jgi:hypothetical protein
MINRKQTCTITRFTVDHSGELIQYSDMEYADRHEDVSSLSQENRVSFTIEQGCVSFDAYP